MARKLYPIGIQTFERIRKEDKFYVDKTEYIYRMTHTDGTYFFLSRPRRFGKSLLVSTFQSYFEGKKEQILDETNFYLAQSVDDDGFQYAFKPLGSDIEPIFTTFLPLILKASA